MPPSGPKHIVLAINPTAAFGASRPVGDESVAKLQALGHTVTVLKEPDFEQLLAATKEVMLTGPDALVVVGGDGMVSLGTGLVTGTSVPLGIIACGTGNDMARGLGLPLGNTSESVRVLAEALARGPRVIDAAHVGWGGATAASSPNGRWFAGVLSAGFDATVNERANQIRFPRGKSRYTVAIMIELLRLKPVTYRLTFDGREMTVSALLVSVGNNVSIGGGMKVTPDAVLDDGLLDVLVVAPLSRLSFLRIFPRVFAGTHLSDPRVSIHRAKHVRIEAEGVVAYADGERVGSLPVDIELHPSVLRVLAPH
ncbi:MAG: YegS/Rv2252/BmrU family lipid kinase [Glaciihabitans sp.]|nr:YegS/Rv2252/BmrU family lipid kinase [Glaciihabitans sp.]